MAGQPTVRIVAANSPMEGPRAPARLDRDFVALHSQRQTGMTSNLNDLNGCRTV